MATKLSQLVAIEKGVKGDAQRQLTDAYQAIQKAPLLSGITRTYTPKDDDGDRLPSEKTLVQVTVPSVLDEVSAALARLVDVTLTKDKTNQVAVADVVVDGRVLIPAAPVPFLLFLEKQLTDLHTFVAKLPVLDPAEQWEREDAGVWQTEVTQTTRTKKIPRNHVKAEATDKHPAQVEIYYEDVVQGLWNTTRLSGAVQASRRSQLLRRVAALQEAVKFAREEANTTPVKDVKAGKEVFSFLFAE